MKSDQIIASAGLPSESVPDSSAARFPDGAHMRIEIPSVEGPGVLAAVLDEAKKRGVVVNRVSQGSGAMLHTTAELREMSMIAADAGLLAHVHALALEWQLTERMHARLGLDRVLSPLLQGLIASGDASTAVSAMNLLAAQARFAQSQRRMQLPLRELPADELHGVIVVLHDRLGTDDVAADKAEQAICAGYDESQTRLGLMSRLIMGMGGGAMGAELCWTIKRDSIAPVIMVFISASLPSANCMAIF